MIWQPWIQMRARVERTGFKLDRRQLLVRSLSRARRRNHHWYYDKTLNIFLQQFKSSRFSASFWGISRLRSAFIFLEWFKLARICIQVSTLHNGGKQVIFLCFIKNSSESKMGRNDFASSCARRYIIFQPIYCTFCCETLTIAKLQKHFLQKTKC